VVLQTNQETNREKEKGVRGIGGGKGEEKPSKNPINEKYYDNIKKEKNCFFRFVRIFEVFDILIDSFQRNP
jgi:hypothetical protein